MNQIITTTKNLLFVSIKKILVASFLLTAFMTGNLSAQAVYGIYPWPFGDSDDVVKFQYNQVTDAWEYDGIAGSSGLYLNYSMAYDFKNGNIYLIGGDDYYLPRKLYRLNNNTFAADELIAVLVSSNGNNNPNAFTISPQGEMFILYQNGRIDKFDPNTLQATPHADVVASGGAAGLAYDYENNRLIHAKSSGPVILSEILSDGTVNHLFDFYTPGWSSDCSAQAMAYMGGGIILASSTFGCDVLYSINLNNQSASLIAQPNGTPHESLKSLFVQPRKLFQIGIGVGQ